MIYSYTTFYEEPFLLTRHKSKTFAAVKSLFVIYKHRRVWYNSGISIE